VDRFGVRFEAFEERMNSVIGDVATRSDVQSLKVLERQIQDLAAHLEQTELQLGRLDGIEQQLASVIEHLSTELEAAHRAVPEPAPGPDLMSLASTAAEEVAQRLSASATARDDARMDEIGSLMRSLIDDRRQSDEQTFTMLDTVQQAMIRLLDRMESIELAQSSAPAPAANAHPLVPPPIATVQPPVSEIQDFGAPEHFGEPLPTVPPPLNAPVAPPAATGPVEGMYIDKLRQDFIADAQRAKAAAAREQPAATATAAAPSSLRVQRGAPRPQSAPANAGTGPSRKQQLTAFALCIVIAVSGAALFVKSRTKAPASPVPAAVSETVPGSASSAVELPFAPGTGSALPLGGDGSGFEVPADEGAGVPAPVPVDPLSGDGVDAAPATGNETPRGPVNGELIENGYSGSASPNVTAQGIVLQSGGRQPTAEELANLQSQQNAAQLSSRLATSAARLTPADLMPEEVAKFATASAAASVTDLESLRPQPASLSGAPSMGEENHGSAGQTAKTVSQMSLPPATVGPLSLRLAAANGDPSAAFEVGARLAEGKGTNQDFHEAVIWYQKSASQGFAQAQYRLATLYERGLGLKKDLGRAQTWYQRAAEQEHVKAMHNLAVISAGRNSGNPDYMTAAQWFERAADYGLSDSQFNLAVLHENGLGIAKDPVKAYKWYALAAQGGDTEALRRRDSLKAQLTADQRLKAERELSAFQPKRSLPLVNDPRVAGEDWKKRQQS
jgi:localization factor PodJL